MAVYNTQKLIAATAAQIPEMAESIRQDFLKDQFEVKIDELTNGGRDISITKGGAFKAVLGMRSAMKVTLTPQMNGVNFDSHVGIFGQQAIPTVISMFFFWPVLITQIWGMVSQSKMDERALAAAERAVSTASPLSGLLHAVSGNKYCAHCGNPVEASAKFCPICGAQQ